jgi:hypothetical protein
MQLEKCHLGRHAKAHRKDAGADSGAHEEVASIRDDVAERVALAVFRRYNRPAENRKMDLPAMGVACDEQAETAGNRRKDIWIVREHKHGSAIGNLAKCFAHVMRPLEEIADANQPKMGFAVLDPGGIVLEHTNSVLLQRRAPSPREARSGRRPRLG